MHNCTFSKYLFLSKLSVSRIYYSQDNLIQVILVHYGGKVVPTLIFSSTRLNSDILIKKNKYLCT